jgi:hypothetical protein
MSGTTTPKPVSFELTAAETMHRAAGLHCLMVGKSAYGTLSKRVGLPLSVSWYG